MTFLCISRSPVERMVAVETGAVGASVSVGSPMVSTGLAVGFGVSSFLGVRRQREMTAMSAIAKTAIRMVSMRTMGDRGGVGRPLYVLGMGNLRFVCLWNQDVSCPADSGPR